MKRSQPLQRRTPLRSRSQQASRTARERNDPARIAWKTPEGGRCECGCGTFSWHLERHHVLPLALLKREADPSLWFDARNGMLLSPRHHRWHTDAYRRIPLASVPAAARVFADEVLGEDRAVLFFERTYGATA